MSVQIDQPNKIQSQWLQQRPQSTGTECKYANKIEIEESEHDVTLVFKREVMNKDLSIARVSVPRSLWEELVK